MSEAVLNPRAPCGYHLGAGGLDLTGPGGVPSGSLAVGQIAQAAGASDTETMDPARDPV